MPAIEERRSSRVGGLITPQELLTRLPLDVALAEDVTLSRKTIAQILTGQDRRLLVIIGPCSLHDPDAALDYARRLAPLRRRYRQRLEIVMRAYFEKPRSVTGWKGLVSDPALNGSFRINDGLALARGLLLDINRLGLPTATEFLDTMTVHYIADLISWGAIGARTTESQIHRQMASALACPVGFKNGTDGNTQIAIDAIRAAGAAHCFAAPDPQGRLAVYQSSGNPFGHLIMRGGRHPNYSAGDIAQACSALGACALPQRLIIDFSHANCQKQHRRQLDVAQDVCRQIRSGSAAIAGVMAESFLLEGNQSLNAPSALTYGQSITDPCLGWRDSERLLEQLAEAVDGRV
ncbi:3-deoxy-7-phosphoheptulonate synthase [Affinibrenneria salicis]|uniref:Phospho-2-dehydro-3-deoxyheptonate aldolase n=1 Tax=Affinibrenneria salicis TaxID=2590031 RepID=A0A5J5G3C9_9GAMM|nr:3-deoxy-7-phosphoheptulonate synthase [Affinibrenneria salicis]KAA9001232.1 3-deoxy-7-phosphoheptulonate synthase [Affinibrenneria salicis]